MNKISLNTDWNIDKGNLLIFALIFTVLMLIFTCGVGDVSAAGNTIYVNGSSGNDAWNGLTAHHTASTLDGPKLTITNGFSNVNENGTLRIADGIYVEGDLTIDKNMTIHGQSRDNTIIKYHFISNIPNGVNVTITDLTVSNAIYGDGGAIHNSGNLTLINCGFTNNRVTMCAGAIMNEGGNVDVVNCTFTGNTGGQLGMGAIANYGNLNVSKSIFLNNNGYNGVIYNGGSLKVNYCWIYGNTDGLFIYNDINHYPDATADASFNWWGSNGDPSGYVYGLTVTSWLMLNINASPSTIANNGHSTITVDFLHDNYGNLVGDFLPDGMLVKFTPSLGIIADSSNTINGKVESLFTANGVMGTANIMANIDHEYRATSVLISSTPKISSVNPLNNAYVLLNRVIKITFSEPIKNGNMWIDLKNSKGQVISTTKSVNSNVLTITHSAIPNGKYYLFLHSGCVTSLVGIPIAAYSSSFTVDSIAPKIWYTTPSNLKTGVNRFSTTIIKFNENIKSSSYYYKITIRNLITGKYSSLSKTISGNTLYIKTATTKSAKTWYQVIIPKGAIKDYTGNNLAAVYTFKFKT